MAMVSYTHETMPPVSQEDWDRVAAIKDEDIDCSDIPEITSLEGLRLRVPTPDWGDPRLAKIVVTCEPDADASDESGERERKPRPASIPSSGRP
jgi:hypothetical protein